MRRKLPLLLEIDTSQLIVDVIMTSPKILKQNSSRLVIGRPWLQCLSSSGTFAIFGFVLPMGFWVVALWFIFQGTYGAGQLTLTCKRIEPTSVECEESRSHLFGLIPPSSIFTLKQVTQARVDSRTTTYEDANGMNREKTTYWLTLVSRAGSRKSQLFINHGPVAHQINQFIEATQGAPTLQIQQDNYLSSILSLLLGGVFIFGGYKLLKVSTPTCLVFDKNKRILSIGKRKIPFRSIIKVVLHQGKYWDRNKETSYLSLILENDVYLVLWFQADSPQGSSDIHTYPGLKDGKFLLETIQNFLGLPKDSHACKSDIIFLGDGPYDRSQKCFYSVRHDRLLAHIQSVHLKQQKDSKGNIWYCIAAKSKRGGAQLSITGSVGEGSVVPKAAMSELESISKVLEVPVGEPILS